MQHFRYRNTISAVVCAAVFPLVLFAVFFMERGIAELLGFNTNPVAGIMFLSIAMTRAYPALLLLTFIVGLPTIVWAEIERALRPALVVAVGAPMAIAIAVGTTYSVGLFNISLLLSVIWVSMLTVPLLLCFCLFAVWVQRNSRGLECNRQPRSQQLIK